MASSPEQLTEEDKSSKLYQWVMHRSSQPTDSVPASSETVREVYDEQAPYYDELYGRKMGWTAWREGADILHSHLEKLECKKDVRILDAGAGTGLVGKRLSELGYSNITALDISSEMLTQCKAKGCYQDFIQCDLNEESLDAYNDSFDVVIGIGIFSKWLVKSSAMDKLANCTKKDGVVCFSFGVSHFEPLGFKAKAEQLIESGKWKQIGFEASNPHYVESLKVLGHYAVYRVM